MSRSASRSFVLTVLLALVGVGGLAGRAHAGEGPTPTFDEALAAARREGKPLVIDLYAVWCGPCKMLAKALAQPEAKAGLDAVHFVKMDGEQEPGLSVMEKYGAMGFPTVLAFDADGKEIDRFAGFDGLANTVSWLRELPIKGMPLVDLLAKAKKAPKDAMLQLAAARKLARDGRAAEAKAFYKKAQAGEARYAATATWEEGRDDLASAAEAGRQKLAERVVTKFPASDEADLAIRYLATLPKPPVAVLEGAIAKRAAALKDQPTDLNGLAYVALRGGALSAAQKVATRLEELSKEDPGRLDTCAEVWHMSGQRDKAVAIEERAIAMAKGPMASGLRANLDRFRSGSKELSADVTSVRAPSLDPQPAAMSERRPRSAPAVKAQATAMRRIPDECGALAGNTDRVVAYLFSADKPATPRVIVRPGTPKVLADCVTKVLTTIEVTGGQVVRVDAALEAPAVREAFKAAQDKAQKDCATVAAAAKVEALEGSVSGDANGKALVTLATPNRDLQACVEKAYASVKLSGPTLKPLSFTFAKAGAPSAAPAARTATTAAAI